MTATERTGLFRCLTKEYFDIDKQTGMLVDWLRSNSAPFSLLNATTNPLKNSPPVKMTHLHD